MPPPVTSAAYLARLQRVLAAMDAAAIDRAIDVVGEAWKRGAQVVTLGNGGSALTALHFATDWSKGVFTATGRPLEARSLTDNIGVVTALANDMAFADIFREQLRYILKPGDVVVAISGSGNSENVIRAVDYANEHGAVTVGLCGYRGGRLKEKARHVVWADIDDMQLCEDIHAIFGHIAMQRLCSLGAP